MLVVMDLNALPEEDEETFDPHVEVYSATARRIESGIDIANRVLANSPFCHSLSSDFISACLI